MPESGDACSCRSSATGGLPALGAQRKGSARGEAGGPNAGSELLVSGYPSKPPPARTFASPCSGSRSARLGLVRFAVVLAGGGFVCSGCHAAPGVETAAFASGKPKSQVALQRTSQGGAVRHGWYRSWHENGRMHEEGLYVQGEKHGVWTVWDAQGRKRGHEVYDGGQRAGRWLAWHANGRLARQEQYAAGKPHGVWRWWDESGGLVREEAYDQGMKVDHRAEGNK